MNMKAKYYLALAIVFLASLALIVLFRFFPIWHVVSDLAGMSAIASLFAALFQLARDRIAFDRSVRLEENRNRFTIGATSHMASVAFDKHVSFCEEYVAEMQNALTNLFTRGPHPEFTIHANNLRGIRQKWVLWQTPELETELTRYEAAIKSIGGHALVLKVYSKPEEGRSEYATETYRMFAEIAGLEAWKGEKASEESAVATILKKLRHVLGVDELTHLRSELVKRALENLKTSG
jgi:hypothetical protein